MTTVIHIMRMHHFSFICTFRWLLDSAARHGLVSLATLPSALLEGLKHSVSRQDLLSLTPVPKQKRSRSLDNISKIRRPDHPQPSGSHSEVKRSKTDVATRNRPLVMDPRFTPSIGSRTSSRSVVSSTVEMAAHLARSSGVVTNKAGYGAFKVRGYTSCYHICTLSCSNLSEPNVCISIRSYSSLSGSLKLG